MNISEENLKAAMRHWTTGVSVVCSSYKNEYSGMTVNSFASVSLDPPLVIITMNNETMTKQSVDRSGKFSVSILSNEQQFIAERFAGKLHENRNKFTDIKIELLPGGTPAISDSLAILECDVFNTIPLTNSTIIIGKVIFISYKKNGAPLVYHNREYASI